MIQAGYIDVGVFADVDVEVDVYFDVNVHSDVNVIFDVDIDVDGLNYPMNFVPLAMLVKPNDCQKCFKIVQLNLVLFNPEMDFLLKPLNVINPLNLFFLFFSPSHLYQH